MRLVLANPHTFAYGKLVSGLVFGKRTITKYDFFIRYYIKKKPQQVAFYIDGTRNSFNINLPFGSLLFSYLELLVWMLANRINPFKIKVYFGLRKLRPESDVIFTFARSIINVSEKNKLKLHEFKGIVLVHFTHYFQKTESLLGYIKNIPHCIIIAENNLVQNAFFKEYFPFIEEVYQLPYTFSDRFVLQEKDFEKRINKCIALGTLCPADEKEFCSFFKGESALQPMRRILYGQSHRFSQEIDSFIKGFVDIRILKKINPEDSFFIKIMKKLLPYVILERIIPVPQREYFKFDIVKQYNQYRMFVCPEEAIGLPSVNVFEGMACGCAYIGINDPMYTNLGMSPGAHYIAYKENDIEDLASKIRYYQAHPQELREIAINGYNFVRENFTKKKVAEVFWNDLEKISIDFSVYKKVGVNCSFKNSQEE